MHFSPRDNAAHLPHTRNPDHFYGKLNGPVDEIKDLINCNYQREHLQKLETKFAKNRSFTEGKTFSTNRKFLGLARGASRRLPVLNSIRKVTFNN
jgi:hypothetical protein